MPDLPAETRLSATILLVRDADEQLEVLMVERHPTISNALELEKTGQRTIIFPTLDNLKKLGRSQRVDEALRYAKRDSIVTVLPALNKDAEGEIWLERPESSGYDTVRAPTSALLGDSPGNGDKS